MKPHLLSNKQDEPPYDRVATSMIETEMMSVTVQTIEGEDGWMTEELVVKLKDGAMFHFDPHQLQASHFPLILTQFNHTHRLSVLTVEKHNDRQV